ncbi:MAG: hypothetical protein ACK5RN_14125 [bacterium]
MRKVSILVLTLLAVTACAPEESARTPQTLEAFRGKTIVFKSNAHSSVVALYLDDGAYRNYADVSEIGGPSDIGGALAACSEGISKCVEVAGLYLMVPPPSEAGWSFGGYDFHLVADSSDREGHVVVVSRDGDESYSYGFSPRCGVRWLNVSVGREEGDEVFYPVGRSLFSESVCTPAPTA